MIKKNNMEYSLIPQIQNKKKIYPKYLYYIYKFILIFFILIIFTLDYIHKKDNDNNLSNNIKVALCAIGKKENLYALEFVNHYEDLGYDHIFIYDNNNINDERFEDVLRDKIDNNFVTIINYRGFKACQLRAYDDCFRNNKRYYNWLSFFDFDEFLILKKENNIKNFLEDEKFKNCKNVKINGLYFSDNDLIYYENKGVKERFTTPLYNVSINQLIKSTVRSKGNLKNIWTFADNPHSAKCKNSCNSLGKYMGYKEFLNKPPDYEYAYFNHYNTKTIQEYIERIKKGFADRDIIINNDYYKERIEYFFNLNKKTKEKIDYIKKTLNISIE